MCTIRSGGKTPGATRPGTFFKTRQTLIEEAFSPHADDFTSCIESGCDLIVAEALGGKENHLGAEYSKIR